MKIRNFVAILAAAVLFAGCGSSGSESSKTTSEGSSQGSESSQTEEVKEEKIVYEVDRTKPLIALTFDDGPNTTTTNDVLDKLVEYQVPATFFLIGNNINEQSGETVKRAYALGCEIENHSLTHSYMTEFTEDEIKAEIEETNKRIEDLIGVTPKFFRPPYIAVNVTMYDSVDQTFIAGIGANDWDDSVTAEMRADKIIEQAKDGAIILLHDAEGNSMTVDALDEIITTLKDQGYQFVTVEELFKYKGVELSPLDSRIYTFVEAQN